MIDDDFELERIIKDEPESPILEFKSEWYWKDNDSDKNSNKKWGEFLKDILGLANGYLEYVGKIRYLIIGVNEDEDNRKIQEVDCENIKILQNLNVFHRIVSNKIENHATPSLPKIEIYWKKIQDQKILIIEIPSPPQMVQLQKELQTKTRSLDRGAVLIRKGQKKDEVRVASPEELKALEREFREYKKNNNSPSRTEIGKERSINKMIMELISMNSSWALVKDYPIQEKNWNENIIFEVFKIQDSWGEIKYFIYIHEDSSQGKTFKYLETHSIIDSKLNLYILTEKPEKLKDPEERRKRLGGIFDTDKVYFIDEFGYQFLYKNCFPYHQPFPFKVFIKSYSDSDSSQKTALERLNEWYSAIANPMLVVKGYGGIGKTTLVKYFLNTVHQEDPTIGILFIDSNNIIDELNRLVTSDKSINDIFDFYQASYNSKKSDFPQQKFSQNSLQLSSDHGRLIIVLDGIDEVITKLGRKFDVDKFLENIQLQYCTDLEKTKIIITCRDYFWDRIKTKVNISEITLIPFNQQMAEQFFEKRLSGNRKKVLKSMEFAETFLWSQSTTDEITSDEKLYIPYILEMIADSYQDNSYQDDIETNEPEKQSTILKMKEIRQDYIMGSFCGREISKLGNFDVDNQIRLFMNLSITFDGKISVYEIQSLLKELNIAQNGISDSARIEKLRGHPILNSNSEEIFFRYDFFKSYFISVYISNFFSNRDLSKIDEELLVTLLATYIKFDSSETINICRRFDYGEDLIEFGYMAIEQLRGSNYNDDIKGKAISAIFVAILVSLRESSGCHFGVEECTNILKEIFMNNNEITGLFLIDVFSYEKRKLIFDFKGLVFKNCYFDNYSSFWDCQVDDNTYFIDSKLKSLMQNKSIQTTLKRKQFHHCDIKEIESVFDENRSQETNQREKVVEDLKIFFRLFWSGGNFHPKRQEYIRGKQRFHKYIQILLDNQVIEECCDPCHPKNNLFKVCEEYYPITKIIDQGSSCAEFRKVVKMFTS